MVRRLAFALLVAVLGAALLVPAAAAEPLRANVVSVSPNDIDEPDVPVSIVFRLYKPELLSAYPTWGKPISGVNDVQVVIHGQGQTRRFTTEDLSGGRYRAEIVFPEPGGWHLSVGHGAGNYGAGDEIDLGKGAICIAAQCVGQQVGDAASAESSGGRWMTVMIAVAAVLLSLAVLVAAGLAASRALTRRGGGARDELASPRPRGRRAQIAGRPHVRSG